MNASRLSIPLAIILAFVLLGCGSVPTREIQQFGAATVTLSESAAETFHQVNEWSIRRKIYDAASDTSLHVDTSSLGDLTTTNVRGLFDPTDPHIGAPDLHAEFTLRIELLEELGRYGKALELLATADVAEEIDEASIELRGALSSLNETYKVAQPGASDLIDATDLNVIATAVNAVARSIAESRRRAALKAIIKNADPVVQSAATLITTEFTSSDNVIDMMEQSAANVRGSIQQAYNADKGELSFDERVHRLETLRGLYIGEITMVDASHAIAKAAQAMASAHQEMKKQVLTSNGSLSRLRRDVESLVSLAKDVRRFHKSLQGSE